MPTVKETFDAMSSRFRAEKAAGANATITYDLAVSAPMLLITAFAVGAAFGTKAGETLGARVRAFLRNPPLLAFVLALPLIALGGYSIVAAGVGFAIVRWVKTAENATDYSIMNTARQLLWLPTTRDEKYKAKQAIDTFFVRGGDLLSAGVVFLGTSILHLSVAQFATGNVVLTLAWLGVAMMILKDHARLTSGADGSRSPSRTAVASGRICWARHSCPARYAGNTLAIVVVPLPRGSPTGCARARAGGEPAVRRRS